MQQTTALALADLFVEQACREHDIPFTMVDKGSFQAIASLVTYGMSMSQATEVIMEPYIMYVDGGIDDEGMAALAAPTRETVQWLS